MTVKTEETTPEKETIPPQETVTEIQPEPEKEPAPVAPTTGTEQKKIAPTNEMTDAFNQIGESLKDAKPEKQPHFVKAVKDKRETEADKKTAGDAGQDWRYLKDRSGRYWNADICENKADPKTGLPIKTASGLWKLKRSATSKDRRKLPKRPPNIEQKVENAETVEQAQQQAEAEAAGIQQRAIISTKAILAGHRAIMSQVSGEKAVKDILGYQIGEGQFKVKMSDLLEAAGVEMMIKRGGGVSLPPEAIFIGGLVLSSGAIYLHPSKPERRESLKEKAGLFFHRLKKKKRNAGQATEKRNVAQGETS